MFASNPIAALTSVVPLEIIQGYVILMVVLVVGGTLLDMLIKKNAAYFFAKAKAAEASRTKILSPADKINAAVSTLALEVATSADFCNIKRRLSHLLTMYGFLIFLFATLALVFAYPIDEAPVIASQLWHLGAAMVTFGGFWFWFFIRVDVSAEGMPWNRIVQADLFVLSLLGTTTFGLIWSFSYSLGATTFAMLPLALFIASATILFSTVYWSKFAHMFFKPAAALNRRITVADGSRENLPEIGDLSDPEIQKLYPDIPEYLGTNPPNMGLGIGRDKSRHY